MADTELTMTLGKVIIAAAWADGEIANDEVNCLKDLIYRMPEVTARQWEELEIYMAAPVGDAERARLIADLRQQTASESQRRQVLHTLDEMVGADGEVSAAEAAVVEEVKAALESADVGLWGSFSRLLIGRRSEAVAGAPNRERYLDDFINNRVYYDLRREMAEAGQSWDIPDAELRRLALAGGLMALVVRQDEEVTGGERAAMAEALETTGGLTPERAAFVTGVALAEGSDSLDFYRLVRQFAESYTLEESRGFLATLFAVAAADGRASFDEIEQLRLVAQGLKLTHQEFIEAKLSLPREKRAD